MDRAVGTYDVVARRIRAAINLLVETVAQILDPVEAGADPPEPPPHARDEPPRPLSRALELGIGREADPPPHEIAGRRRELAIERRAVLAREELVADVDALGRRDEPHVDLGGALRRGELGQAGELLAVRLHPRENDAQAGQTRLAVAASRAQGLEAREQAVPLRRHPDLLVGLRRDPVDRSGDGRDAVRDDGGRGGRRHGEQVRRKPEVRNAVAPRHGEDVAEARVDHGLGGAPEGDPPSPGKKIRRDLLEDLEGEVAVGRKLAVERSKRQPVGGREVAHDALQVAAGREVEDDVEGPGHAGIMSPASRVPAAPDEDRERVGKCAAAPRAALPRRRAPRERARRRRGRGRSILRGLAEGDAGGRLPREERPRTRARVERRRAGRSCARLRLAAIGRALPDREAPSAFRSGRPAGSFGAARGGGAHGAGRSPSDRPGTGTGRDPRIRGRRAAPGRQPVVKPPEERFRIGGVVKHLAHHDRVPGAVGGRVGIRVEAGVRHGRTPEPLRAPPGVLDRAFFRFDREDLADARHAREGPFDEPAAAHDERAGQRRRQVPRAHVGEPVDSGIARDGGCGGAGAPPTEPRTRRPGRSPVFRAPRDRDADERDERRRRDEASGAEPRGPVRQEDTARAGIEAHGEERAVGEKGRQRASRPVRGRPAAVLDEGQDDVSRIGSADARREGGGVRRLRVVRDLDGRIRDFSAAVIQNPGRIRPVGGRRHLGERRAELPCRVEDRSSPVRAAGNASHTPRRERAREHAPVLEDGAVGSGVDLAPPGSRRGRSRFGQHVPDVQEVERGGVDVAKRLEVALVVRVAACAVQELHVVVPLEGVVGADVFEPREDVRARKQHVALSGDAERARLAAQKAQHRRVREDRLLG